MIMKPTLRQIEEREKQKKEKRQIDTLIKYDRAKICPKCGELMRYAFGEVFKCDNCGAEIRYGRYCPACAAKHNKGQNVGIFNSEAGEVPKHKRDAYGKMHTLDVMEKTRNKR